MTNRIINIGAFIVLTALWVAFGAALLLNQGLLDSFWQMFTGCPLIVQAIVALLTLPVAAGLWVWETTWPLLIRLVLVAGLAWVTVYTFFPRKPRGQVNPPARNA